MKQIEKKTRTNDEKERSNNEKNEK